VKDHWPSLRSVHPSGVEAERRVLAGLDRFPHGLRTWRMRRLSGVGVRRPGFSKRTGTDTTDWVARADDMVNRNNGADDGPQSNRSEPSGRGG
jgi:hypothetical protein